MQRQHVSSSDIESIGYDESARILEIAFLSGDIYQYSGVPKYIYQELMNASSHGSYLAKNIKNVFSYQKI